ncbi:MAG: FAD binding domain-containing protein [Candidatus Caldarchaeum sp.]|nr:FAD binding domain-containing protein [Candidatus Caldarchaeum sp.]MDW8062808.1 FAD binding domain-containing protein [Candidatus Caldarchaeum sp.]
MKAVPSFDVYVPSTIKELLEILREKHPNAVIYAGGTDLMPMMKRGKIRPEAVVDITGLTELSYVKADNGVYRVGGLTTIQDFATSPLIPEKYFSIKWLTKYFGAETTRNMATVGGNVVSGGERDVPAILTSLDGHVKIVGPQGERLDAPLELKLGHGEIVTELVFPDWGLGSVSWFSKFEKRASNGIGVVTAAVSLKCDDDRVEKARIVLNRVQGKTMGRLTGLEEELVDRRLSSFYLRDLVERHVASIKPAGDFRASGEFRKHVSKVLIVRGLEFCMKYLTEAVSK